ncbi:MAG: replicative DNA helicase [Candidatus Beckwithbacteria bacterium]
MSSSLRVPPHSLQAEQSILGAVLIDKDAVVEVASFLRAKHFYDDKHIKIFEAVMDLYENRDPIDVVTVSDKLKSARALKKVGGSSYLTELVNRVPTSAHVEKYAKIVKGFYTKRTLISQASKLVEDSFDETLSITKILDNAEKTIFGLSQDTLERNFLPIKDVLAESFDRLDELHKTAGGIRGVSSGFKDIDNVLAGFQKSNLIILAARPGMGKTSLAVTIAQHVAVEKKMPVGYFSLEMSQEELVDRLLVSQADIDAWKLKTGRLNEKDFSSLSDAMGELAEAPLYIDDTPGMSIMEMRTKARRLQSEHGLGLLVVDYLQLAHSRNLENRVQEISEVSMGLKNLARELRLPVIALSQLSRAVEHRGIKKPQLADLRECLTKETEVVNANTGEIFTIEELINGKSKMAVWGIDENKKLVKSKVLKTIKSGKKRVFKLTTRSGRVIRASANHPFYTIFGWKKLESLKKGECVGIARNLPVVHGSSSKLLGSDEKIRLLAQVEKEKIIPKEVFMLGQKKVEMFLKHLWATDGCVNVSKNKRVKIYYASSSKKLVDQVSHLLLRSGIVSTIIENKKKGYKVVYQVAVSGAKMQKRFFHKVGVFGAKEQIGEKAFKILMNLKSNLNVDVLPKDVWKIIDVVRKEKGLSWRDFAKKLGMSYCGSTLFKSGVSRERMKRIGEFLDDDRIHNLSNSDIYWDEIVSIEKQGIEEVFDLVIEKVHNFVANDVIVHNSGGIEQDADVVMFLYREDPEDLENCKLMVAKHRNGALATIDLRFRGDRIKFYGIEKRRKG